MAAPASKGWRQPACWAFPPSPLTGITLIAAGAGNDTVVGSAGADVIAARAGLGLLTGRLGADRFDFNLASESRGTTLDQILDFTSGSDLIDLIGVDANRRVAGDRAFSFIGTAAFLNASFACRAITEMSATINQKRDAADGL